MTRRTIAVVTTVVVALAILIPSICSQPAMAAYTWNDLKGPGDGDARALAYDATHGALYRGTSSRGVWKYSGATWTSIGGALISSEAVYCLVYDPARDVLYAGVDDPSGGGGPKGVWRCARPATAPAWSSAGSALEGTVVNSLALDSAHDVLYAGLSGADVHRGVRPDGATSWTDIGIGPGASDTDSLACDPVRDRLYAVTDGGLVQRCSTPGTSPSWDYLLNSACAGLAFDPVNNVLYTGTDQHGVERCFTPDAAPNWQNMGGGLGTEAVESVTLDTASDLLFAGTTSDVWCCTTPEGAAFWSDTGGTLTFNGVRALAYDPARDVVYAGTQDSGAWQCAHPDTAPVWSETPGGVSTGNICSLAYDGAHDVLFTGTFFTDGVWRCSNPDTAPIWTDTGGAVSGLAIRSLAYDPVSNVLFAGTGEAGVWRCADPDTAPSWRSTGGALSGLAVPSLAYDEAHDTLYAGTDGRGVWRCGTAKTAPSWIDTDGAVRSSQVGSLDYIAASDVLLAGTSHDGLFRCADPRTQPFWVSTGAPLSGSLVLESDPGGGFLFAGTAGQGVWDTSPGPVPAIALCFGASARQGESLSVDITGSETNFAPGKSRAVFSGIGITVTSTTVTDATHATAKIKVGAQAPPGVRDVNVVTGPETPVALSPGFTVNRFEPPGTSTSFYFAEGTCRPNFDAYLCIQNPGATDATVRITYMKGDGSTDSQTLTVPKNSRSTVKVKDRLGEANDAAHDFSARVESTNGAGIIAERPMYFNYNGVWTGGHDVVGFMP